MKNVFKVALALALVFGLSNHVMAEAEGKKECKKKKVCIVSKFKKLDEDKNGSLSLAEFGKCAGDKCENGKKKLFSKLDKNEDGQLSLEEFKAIKKKCKSECNDKSKEKQA